MPDDHPHSPYPVARLPTLTEVLELGSMAPESPAPFSPPALLAAPAPDAVAPVDLPVLLTEVVTGVLTSHGAVADAAPDAAPGAAPDGHDTSTTAEPTPGSTSQAPIDTEVIVARVLAQLEPRIAQMLETRVSEALAPALARAADGLIRDSREQLGVVLQDLVRETLAQVLRDAARFERHAP